MFKKLTILFSFILFTASVVQARETIDVTRGTVDPIPLAINEFDGTDPGDTKLGNQIIAVITNDLRGSGLFRPISKAAFIETKTGIKHEPLMAAWQQINASLLVNGEVDRISSSKVKVSFVLWDIYIGKKMVEETFEMAEDAWRRTAHQIADTIYKKVTGYEGYFDTQIVYVSERGPYLKRMKRLALMDYDGANHRYLTDGSDLVLTPRFSPDGKKVLYVLFKDEVPHVYEMDLKSGRKNRIGKFAGMSFAPRYAPDGNYAIMSITEKGNTHIYELNLKTKKKKQLSFGESINTSPSYSPDGKQIVFNSDRYNSRQLFIMNRDGSSIRRITYSGGSYAEPNWSSGNFIAFTKISRQHGFTIGVMRPTNTPDQVNERLIAQGYLVETPSWSNNGRVIVFTKGIKPSGAKTKNLNRIYTIDYTGYNEKIVPTPHDASDPDWSRKHG